MTRALVLRAPGINCDRETAQACRLVGFETTLLHINELIKAPDTLLNYHFLVIPGGFSYGDDLGAGTLLAKNLLIHLGKQLRRFVDEGRPVLGICNGFQVLVRAGLLPGDESGAQQASDALRDEPLGKEPHEKEPHGKEPHEKEPHGKEPHGKEPHEKEPHGKEPHEKDPHKGGLYMEDGTHVETSLVGVFPGYMEDGTHVETPLVGVFPGAQGATLTENVSGIFECRWVKLAVQSSNCIFTRGIDRLIELPVAHGEGQFVLNDDLRHLRECGQIALVYTTGDVAAQDEVPYPANPNGSLGNTAGICNVRGNVFGLMPHPERYVNSLQHPLRRVAPNGQGDGLQFFKNAYEYALQFEHRSNTTIQGAAIQGAPQQEKKGATYADSGVDIAAGDQAVRLMQKAIRATQGPEVLAGTGAFAGVFNAAGLQKMYQPALVASTDGVGTKTLLAARAGRYRTIGHDIVNHCVNDLLMQGGKPLFFMDYLAMGKLDPVHAAEIVQGVAEACREVGCALLGGETAEMPDVYQPGAFDLAGTIVGVVEQAAIVNGSTIRPDDVILGLPSSGLHTNGYSLVRQIFAHYDLDAYFPELGEPLIDALLRPHRCYLREVNQLQDYLSDRGRFIKGMAHITGGGFKGNIARILPAGTQAVIDTTSWVVPPLFRLLARLGNIAREEQYRTFNMGIGMVIILSPKGALEARCVLPELRTIGAITDGEGVVLR